MADIITHFKKGTFEEKYWIPAHNTRRTSYRFRKNKKFIRDKCGAPCWVCGAREDLERYITSSNGPSGTQWIRGRLPTY